MASITVTFFICWSPMVVYGFVHDFYREALPERDRCDSLLPCDIQSEGMKRTPRKWN